MNKLDVLWFAIKNMAGVDRLRDGPADAGSDSPFVERQRVLDNIDHLRNQERGHWTKEPPTEPGWYFFRPIEFEYTTTIIEMRRDREGRLTEYTEDGPIPILEFWANKAWWWSELVELPKPPEDK